MGYDKEIVKRGAKARALGLPPMDNPYYESKRMPRATGESIEAWELKADAWEFGWQMESFCGNGASRDAETNAETGLDGQTVQPAGNTHGA